MTVRRGSFPNGSGLVQLPRGSFIVDNGRHIEADAILQPPPAFRVLSSQQRAPHPIVLRAITHPVSQSRAAAGYESHECPKRRTDNLRHPTTFVSLVNALRSEEESGMAAGGGEVDVSQHRLYDRCIRPLSCYASHRPQQRPSHYPSVIARSLVGRPVMQFRGRSVGTDHRAKRDHGFRQTASQIVNLADDSASESYSDTCPDGNISATLCPSVHPSGTHITSVSDRFERYRAESWTTSAAPGVKSWQTSKLPAVCFSSNGMMQMELHSCRTSCLDSVPQDEHTYEDGISAVDLDSLSIAQGIGMSGPTLFPQTSTPPTTASVSLDGICNLISDDEDREPEMRRQESAPATREKLYDEASRSRRRTDEDRTADEKTHQSRVMECLQPLLNAIDIVSMQDDDDASLPTSSAHQKPDDDEKETDASRSSPSASMIEQSGPAMRSLNDMTQEMSKSVQQRKQRRQGRRPEDLWRTRRSLYRQDALLNESGDEEGSSAKRTRLDPAEEDDEETFNPYRKLYRKRSSQRRSLNGTSGEESREEAAPEADALWQFLNDGRSAIFTTTTSAASCSYPMPQAEDLLIASSSLLKTPEKKADVIMLQTSSSDDHNSWSAAVKSWIQEKTQSQLQQLVHRYSLCGLARALLDPSSG